MSIQKIFFGLTAMLLAGAVHANPTIRAITDVQITPENTHVPGGIPVPYDYEFLGSASDCGGGRCYGNQLISTHSTRINNGDVAVVDIVVTPPNQHVPGGPGCPQGYEFAGSFADCGAGRCQGNQQFCVRKANINLTAMSAITDVYVSPEGWHSDAHQCPRAYRRVGMITDCGGARCFGNQFVCVK